jgi:hypothetical protein
LIFALAVLCLSPLAFMSMNVTVHPQLKRALKIAAGLVMTAGVVNHFVVERRGFRARPVEKTS